MGSSALASRARVRAYACTSRFIIGARDSFTKGGIVPSFSLSVSPALLAPVPCQRGYPTQREEGEGFRPPQLLSTRSFSAPSLRQQERERLLLVGSCL